MIRREPFDAAQNVTAIRYRLAPIDVGFNLRAEGVIVAIVETDDEPVRVSYADDAGARWVLLGTASEVRDELRRLGFQVAR